MGRSEHERMSASMRGKRAGVCTVNVGNTHASIVRWRANGTSDGNFVWKTHAEVPGFVLRFLGPAVSAGAPLVLAGVVPVYVAKLSRHFARQGWRVLRFRREVPAPLRIMPRPEKKVGDDRVAGALGALALFPTQPCVVVDFGTAVTINAVTPGRGRAMPRFEGGLIFPSEALNLKALHQFTAVLPRLAPERDFNPCKAAFIGRDTEEAMRLGVAHAQLAAAAQLAHGQAQQLGPRTRVVVTGGGMAEHLEYCFCSLFPKNARVCSQLVHLGLFSAWKAARDGT